MIKLTIKEPDQKHINKYLDKIFLILFIFFVSLLYLSTKYKFNKFDKIIIYITLLSQLSTFYCCFIKWNSYLLAYNHYLFVFLIIISLYVDSTYLLMYYFIVILLVIIIWIFNNNTCIFGKLDWDFTIINNNYNFNNNDKFIFLLIYIYFQKINKKLKLI
jgi:hypothetical protein